MDQQLYIEILYFLSDKGIGAKVDIKGICSKYIINSTEQDDSKRLKSIEDITKILDLMRTNYHISINNNTGNDEYLNLKVNGAEFLVAMLPKGSDYINQYKLVHSNLALNEGSKRSAKTQRKFSRTTIAVAAIGALTSMLTFICNNPQIRDAEERIKVLETKTLKQDTIIRDLQSLLSSLKDSSHTHPPSFSSNGQATSDKKVK